MWITQIGLHDRVSSSGQRCVDSFGRLRPRDIVHRDTVTEVGKGARAGGANSP